MQVARPLVAETKQRYPQLAQCSFDKGFHSAANRRAREGTSRAGRRRGRECAQWIASAAARAEGTHFGGRPRPKSPRKRSRKGSRARTDTGRTVAHSEEQGFCHRHYLTVQTNRFSGVEEPLASLVPLQLQVVTGARAGRRMERVGAALPPARLPPVDRAVPALFPAGPPRAQAGLPAVQLRHAQRGLPRRLDRLARSGAPQAPVLNAPSNRLEISALFRSASKLLEVRCPARSQRHRSRP